MAVHNHGTEEGEGLACREVLVDGELKGACLRQDAERAVTESDPHSFYCAECRATYDFPWARAQDCTCTPIQDFIVQHNASHDTKRLQVNTPVNIRSAEKLGLVDDARESAAPLRVVLPQKIEGIESPADELHRRVFTLLQNRWPAPVFGSYQQLQQISDLTAAVIDTVQTHGTPSFDNGRQV